MYSSSQANPFLANDIGLSEIFDLHFFLDLRLVTIVFSPFSDLPRGKGDFEGWFCLSKFFLSDTQNTKILYGV